MLLRRDFLTKTLPAAMAAAAVPPGAPCADHRTQREPASSSPGRREAFFRVYGAHAAMRDNMMLAVMASELRNAEELHDRLKQAVELHLKFSDEVDAFMQLL